MKKVIIITLIFTISLLLIYGIFSLVLFDTSAKYTSYKEMNHYYESNELYISSDNLSTSKDKYNIINYYNFSEIEFNIDNSISDTQITSYNIDYEITCNILGDLDNYYQCIIDNEDKTINSTLISTGICQQDETLTYDECIEKEYNYNIEKSINNHNFKIIKLKDNENTKVEVEIILNTTTTFSKTLKATYVLNIGNNNKDSIYIDNIKNYDSFCEYTVNNNYNTSKNIKLNINTDNLIFDNTDYLYINKLDYTSNTYDIIDSITFNIDNQSNQKITLYKNNFKNDCTTNDINLIVVE